MLMMSQNRFLRVQVGCKSDFILFFLAVLRRLESVINGFFHQNSRVNAGMIEPIEIRSFFLKIPIKQGFFESIYPKIY